MTTLRCPFCRQAAEGLTLFFFGGGSRLFVCPRCYELLNAKRHQPYSRSMQRLRRVVGQLGKEVVIHESAPGHPAAPCDGQATVAQGPAQHRIVRAAEPRTDLVSGTSLTHGGI